jgi:single-strand DNA-binding protein
MNKVFLIGNLTRDPELTMTQSGISICKFTLAVNRRFTNADGNREADFLPIIVWRAQAESCGKYLKKGSKVAVCGSIQVRTYEGQDGQRKYATEIAADEVEFLNTKDSAGAYDDGGHLPEPPNNFTGNKKPISELKPVDDDLPF